MNEIEVTYDKLLKQHEVLQRKYLDELKSGNRVMTVLIENESRIPKDLWDKLVKAVVGDPE